MKRIPAFTLTGCFFLLQMIVSAPPAVGQNDDAELQSDPKAADFSTMTTQPESESDKAAPGRDHGKAGPFQLFPPPIVQKSKSSAVGGFLADIWTDQKTIWTSPARMNRREFFTIALPLATATAGLIATDSQTSKWLSNSPDQVKYSQQFSRFGAIYTLGFVTGGPLIGGKIIHKPDYTQIGRNAAEALVNAVITGYALKAITQRERPIQGDGTGNFWSGGQSFPSGHAMNSWAVAMAIARTPRCPKWFAITSYTMATAISASRFTANKHFASDILVGAVVGGLIGNYVAKRPR
jgi:membrane-associated phospholipid phosphatase